MVGQEGVAGIGATVIIVFVLICFLQHLQRVRKEEQEADSSRRPPSNGEAGGEDDRASQQLPAAAGSAEVALAAGLPLVCTYTRADGWREGTCGVCLSELADGEAVRVLPACMHYFHAGCVHEWLLAHATCPLCRAPLAAAA